MEINKIYNEDCLVFLDKIASNSIDLILTDPPYEHEINGGLIKDGYFERKLTRDRHINFISNGFDYDRVFEQFDRVCKVPNMIIFCSNKQISKIMSYWEKKKYSVTLLVWKKPNPIPLANGNYVSDVEFMVYVRGKGATYNSIGVKSQLKVFEYNVASSAFRIHPTEKPLDLLKRLLLIHSNENDLVLDCFSGSGTTALACNQERRNFLACEIDNAFFNESVKRFELITSQTQLNLF
jgi:site-specific DNA-methyltransferase (adenine-specific)